MEDASKERSKFPMAKVFDNFLNLLGKSDNWPNISSEDILELLKWDFFFKFGSSFNSRSFIKNLYWLVQFHYSFVCVSGRENSFALTQRYIIPSEVTIYFYMMKGPNAINLVGKVVSLPLKNELEKFMTSFTSRQILPKKKRDVMIRVPLLINTQTYKRTMENMRTHAFY